MHMKSNEGKAYYGFMGLFFGCVRGLPHVKRFPKRSAGVWLCSALLSIQAISPIALVVLGIGSTEVNDVVPALLVLIIFGYIAQSLFGLRRRAAWLLGGLLAWCVGKTLLRDTPAVDDVPASLTIGEMVLWFILVSLFLYALYLHRKGVLR